MPGAASKDEELVRTGCTITGLAEVIKMHKLSVGIPVAEFLPEAVEMCREGDRDIRPEAIRSMMVRAYSLV